MFKLFNKEARLRSDIEELKSVNKDLETVRKYLNIEVRELTDKVEYLKSKRKIEEEELKHMVKIAQEKREIEFQKKEVRLDKTFAENLAKAELNFNKKLQELLLSQVKDGKEMYAQILKRLPDMNVRMNLKGDA